MIPPRLATKIDFGECWLWLAAASHGYGRVRMDGRTMAAHRVIWELLVGPIPAGLILHHRCDHKLCVNPDHLELMAQPGHAHGHNQREVCHAGHVLDEANTRVVVGQDRRRRHCRECDRKYWRRPHRPRRLRPKVGDTPDA
jgi:hypothetical protein